MKERKPYARHVKGKLLGWYLLWEGKQIWLGRFEQEALENWKRLKVGEEIIRPGKVTLAQSAEPTLRQIAEIYLDYQQGHGSQSTYLWYMRYLQALCEFDGLGNIKVSVLKKHMIQRWIDTNRKKDVKPWGDNTCHAAARCVIAAFRYAVEWGHLKVSPIDKLPKVRATAREDCELNPEDWKRVMEAIDDPDFRDAVVFMRLTGARPMECRLAERRHFKPTIPAIVYPKEEAKGARDKKRERVIRLSGEALVIVLKLCERYPEGALFRNGNGEPWKKDSFARRFSRLGKKLELPNLIPYSLRHSFATDAVIRGVDSIVLAKLMGHASTKMLESTYAKHARRDDFMNEQMAKAIDGIASVAGV